MNLAYTLGWYEGNFDTAGLPNFAYKFLFNRQRTSGDERHRFVLSEVSPIPFGFMLSSITTLASPRPFVSTDGRDINLDNITGDDYLGGTVGATGNRTVLPANSFRNWYRTVDLAPRAAALHGQAARRSAFRPRCSICSTGPTTCLTGPFSTRRPAGSAVVRQCRPAPSRPPGAGRHAGEMRN